jgi:hypothetical protein
MPRSRTLAIALAATAAVTCAAVAVVGVAVVHAEVYQSTFRSPAWGVELTVPHDWELSEQVSYPGILAYATHHKLGGRMTLSAQLMEIDQSIKAYLERNEKALRQIGYRVSGVTRCRSSVPMLEAFTADRKKRIVQAYQSRGRVAYVLTLAASPSVLDEYLGAYCDTLGSMAFFAAAAPDTAAPKKP